MRIAITGPSGSGKTSLAAELARTAGLRHVEIDALHHGPNWESCGPDVLRERVLAAIEEDGWVTDSTYHTMLGDLVSGSADVLVWLDLPIPLVMWRLLRRTHVRSRDKIELWNGNVEPGWRESTRYLIWPALGVAEDPATGSAAGPLALHLARHGRIAFGDEIEISQGAEIGRPSTLYARVDGNAEAVDRIEVGGSAVIVARGEFRL